MSYWGHGWRTLWWWHFLQPQEGSNSGTFVLDLNTEVLSHRNTALVPCCCVYQCFHLLQMMLWDRPLKYLSHAGTETIFFGNYFATDDAQRAVCSTTSKPAACSSRFLRALLVSGFRNIQLILRKVLPNCLLIDVPSWEAGERISPGKLLILRGHLKGSPNGMDTVVFHCYSMCTGWCSQPALGSFTRPRFWLVLLWWFSSHFSWRSWAAVQGLVGFFLLQCFSTSVPSEWEYKMHHALIFIQ